MEKEIVIEKKNKTIPKGFTLSGLNAYNVVVGENGCGKTNLFEAIEETYKNNSNIFVVYVKASEVKLSEYGKTSADSSELVKQLADILKLVGTDTGVNKETSLLIREICNGVNDAFKGLSGEGGISIEACEGGYIKHEWIVRSVLSSIEGKDGDVKVTKLGEFAQGHQRLLIASFLKSCAGIIKQKIDQKKQVIILFEEPEIYMHPKLKARLKVALEEISKQFQVIISTHDPYFIPHSTSSEKKIVPLIKDGQVTKIERADRIVGIVNEILHISLYAQLEKDEIKGMAKFPRKYWNAKNKKDEGFLPYSKCIRNQIHHPENEETEGLIWEGEGAKKNWYTPQDLEKSIHLMRKILANRQSGSDV